MHKRIAGGFAISSFVCILLPKSVLLTPFKNKNSFSDTVLEDTTERGEVEDHTSDEEYSWYYEGRNGWWLYEERTSRELERHFNEEAKSCELLIAGFLYTIDLENMVQYRSTAPNRRRRIKRDVISIPKKGVAGKDIS